MPLMRLFILLFAAVMLASCQTTSVEKVKIRASTIMLVPLQTLHAELQLYAEPLQKGLQEQFEDKHFTVKVLPAAEFESIKAEALTVSGSVYDPALGHIIPLKSMVFTETFINLVRKKYAYDVIVLPEFVLRTAKINGDDVAWDGTKKEITWKEKPKEPFTLPERASALSLKLSVFTDSGVKVNAFFGGICLPYHLTLEPRGKIAYQLKKPVMANKELKNAIKLANQSLLQQVKFYEK